MRIAVLSDTHGHVGILRRALARLQELPPVDAVLHCGDIGSPAIVETLSAWPTHYVLGNIDLGRDKIPAAIAKVGGQFHGRFGEISFAGVRIALVHSDDRDAFDAAVQSGNYALVCYGHTHRAEQRRDGATIVLNPGALFRAARHSFATVDLPSLQIEHHWL